MNKVIFIDCDHQTQQEFKAVKKFDCIVLNFDYWSTVIPISALDYREKHPTGAAVRVEYKDDWTIFIISGDGAPHWGIYEVHLHNSLTEEIKTAIEAAKKYKLMT